MSYQIIPKVETISNTFNIECINIKIGELILKSSVVVYTDFMNNSGYIIKTTTDKLEGQDYLRWGTDDNYIINFICQKYNLTLQK